MKSIVTMINESLVTESINSAPKFQKLIEGLLGFKLKDYQSDDSVVVDGYLPTINESPSHIFRIYEHNGKLPSQKRVLSQIALGTIEFNSEGDPEDYYSKESGLHKWKSNGKKYVIVWASDEAWKKRIGKKVLDRFEVFYDDCDLKLVGSKG